MGLPLARQKVLLRDGEGSAVRWQVQRVALGDAACCDGWCSVLRGKGQSLGQAQAEGYGTGLFVLLHGESAARCTHDLA